MVDNVALGWWLAERVGVVLAAYFVIILILRFSNYFRVSKCPTCGGKLSRHKRQSSDRWLISLSLGILPVRRYRCYSCYWEGQAFEIKKDPKAPKEVLAREEDL